MKGRKVTLDEFRLSELRLYSNATGELSSLLREIAQAAKRIQAEIRKGGLRNTTGSTTIRNPSGEIVKKLDAFANDELIEVLKNSFSCAGVAGEEIEDILIFNDDNNNRSQYVVMMDPLDGSSNIDNCITVGTIFAIYRRSSVPGFACTREDFIQQGKNIVAAGYVVYGSSTMMVYATKRGVNGFTLDDSIGEFCLSHPGISCPKSGMTYSTNESKILQYPEPVLNYVKGIQQWNSHNPGAFSSRYVGSMAADLHRTLLEGGIFIYPGTKEKAEGKLRLMYECNPFAFIFKISGGAASDGHRDILEIQPKKIHQLSPLFIGSIEMVTSLTRTSRIKNNLG